ncbi:MAG TPA: carboxypeptidase regulatory-like domain-containing protein [Candidatus Angelobacter sp.]|nr:carboxypeptidase regulatory-like domain-containing protein [Candidatus Angelobacter sp.]
MLVLLISSLTLWALPSEPAVPVEGTVINKLTGTPVKGAHVIYTRIATGADPAASPISRDTDVQGHFHLELTSGQYRLWVEREGFARQSYGSSVPEGTGSLLTVSSGQELRDLAFRITPLGALSGRVFDQDGDPLEGVGIQVLRVSYASGMRQLIPVAGSSSNDRGEYRCYDLPADRYFVLATPKGSPLSHSVDVGALVPEVQDVYVPLYYPGVLELESASAVPVPEGGDIHQIDFRLQSIRASTLRGLISGAMKTDASPIQIVLAHNDHGFASYIGRSIAAVDPATGKFEIRRVAPGSYFLVASQFIKGEVFSARVPVEIPADVPPQDVTLHMSSAVETHGTVLMEDASAVPANLVVRLLPAEGLFPGPPPASAVNLDGSVRLSGVLPGTWILSVDHLPEGVWIKSVSFGDIRAQGAQLNVPVGARGLLRVVLAANGGQVSGIVGEEGEPRQAIVVLVPTEAELRLSPYVYRFSATNSRGAFNFKGVRPGSYRLFAFESIAPFAWMDPAILNSVEDLGQDLVVRASEQSTLQLKAIPYDAVLPSR